jgi:putative toxin-antitoxin system antitoxin component (TIGR02293 family)
MSAEKEKPDYLNRSKKNRSKVDEPMIDWDLSIAAAKIKKGLSTDILKIIQDRLDISRKELAQLLMISPRTLDRRFNEDTLPPDESERCYRIERLLELGEEILGSLQKTREWFKTTNFSLGKKTPLETIKTDPGARLVERTLHHIRHGITV